jgi:hypothetical protein
MLLSQREVKGALALQKDSQDSACDHFPPFTLDPAPCIPAGGGGKQGTKFDSVLSSGQKNQNPK